MHPGNDETAMRNRVFAGFTERKDISVGKEVTNGQGRALKRGIEVLPA